ncbi:MAG: 50S ribosomal protein L25 [Planctomycetes bacterium]|nr:50S ribosomal protein L25 [Planctomycetota bacterium]
MEATIIQAKRRTQSGTRVSRREREEGLIPSIIYGHGEEPESVSLPQKEVLSELAHGSRVLEVNIEGQKSQYLIKAVQYDYLGTYPIHLDLMRVDADEKVKVSVGLELRGEPKGLSEGGILEQRLASIDVECLVGQIPETLHPGVSHLELGDSLTVADIEWPPGVVPLIDGDEKVATVRAPAAEVEVEEEAEADKAEPEVIGKPKEESAEDSKE